MKWCAQLRLSGIALLAMAIAWLPAAAHHSSAVYDTGKQIVVVGKVTEVKWVNPHAYFKIQGKVGNGKVEAWEFLLNSPNEMRRAGSTRTSIKVGDEVRVQAYPGRFRTTRAFARWVVLPDGRKTLVTE